MMWDYSRRFAVDGHKLSHLDSALSFFCVPLKEAWLWFGRFGTMHCKLYLMHLKSQYTFNHISTKYRYYIIIILQILQIIDRLEEKKRAKQKTSNNTVVVTRYFQHLYTQTPFLLIQTPTCARSEVMLSLVKTCANWYMYHTCFTCAENTQKQWLE